MRLTLAAAACLLPFAARAEAPVVVTDTPVVQSLVAQVMGDLGSPVVLLEQGADEHSFQLRPSQARALADARLVFWVGPELTPWAGRAIEALAGEADAVALLDAPGLVLRDYASDGGDDGHDHDHDHDHGHGAGEVPLDPHAWLDPANAKTWLGVIAAHLAEADPGNAATYAANSADAEARVDALAVEVAAILEPVHGRPIVTFHDAYGYFAGAFGVELAGSIALGDASAPGARRLSELQAEIGNRDIACIFREPQHDPSIAEAVAEEMGLGIGTLDPSGSSLDYGPGLYDTLLRGMAEEIARCVAGAG